MQYGHVVLVQERPPGIGCKHAEGKHHSVEACLSEQIVQAKADSPSQGNGIGRGHDDSQIYESGDDCLCISAIHAVEELHQAASPGSPYL